MLLWLARFALQLRSEETASASANSTPASAASPSAEPVSTGAFWGRIFACAGASALAMAAMGALRLYFVGLGFPQQYEELSGSLTGQAAYR
jgi:hypothetical protein